MDTVETILRFVESMTYNGNNPIVKLTENAYETGVKAGEKAMEKFIQFIERMPSLEKCSMIIIFHLP